jgi:hypothetical protein
MDEKRSAEISRSRMPMAPTALPGQGRAALDVDHSSAPGPGFATTHRCATPRWIWQN